MQKKYLNHAFFLALGTLFVAPTMAHASLVTTSGNATFAVSGSVSDTLSGGKSSSDGAMSKSNVTLGTTQINQFNANTGVLTGVTVNLNSTQTQKTEVTTPGTTDGNNGGNASASGTGTSTVKLVVPTNVSSATSTATAINTCAGKPKDACSNGATTKQVNANLTVNSNDLNAYVGSGTFGATHIATSLSADTTSNTFNSTATTTSTVDWNGTLSASYSYLLHAAQSFDPSSSMLSLTLDFGTVYSW